MEPLIDSVRKALADENWTAALYLSLTLPDVCARLEADDEKTSNKRFMAWFDAYLAHVYRRTVAGREFVFLSAGDCYALRCALLHEGGTDITGQTKRETLDRFHFTVVRGVHCNQYGSTLQLDVTTFCNDVCAGVTQWLEVFKRDHPTKLTRLETLLKIHGKEHMVQVGIMLQGPTA